MLTQLEKETELIDRHLDILRRIIENEPIGIVKLSNEGGYDHHIVRYSLRILEEDGLIEPTDHGAVTTERTEEFVNHLGEKLMTLIEKLIAMKLGDPTESTH